MTSDQDRVPPAGAVRVLRYAAFSEHGRGGNPAGVVLDAAGLDDADRLAIAAEVGYSETAFLEALPEPGRHRVRYFSPLAEVAFCGHATVAAAVVLAERDGPGELVFDTPAGTVPVRTRRTADGLTATLTSVPTRTRPARPEELDEALAVLGWDRDDLDARYPPHVAHAGNDHLILALRSRARLAALAYDRDRLAALMAARGWTTLQLIAAAGPLVFAARDPFPAAATGEDAATGAAAAALGGYLRDLGLVDLPARVTVLQGEDMGRPSRLLVDVRDGDDRVDVTGTAAPLAAEPDDARPARPPDPTS